MRWALWLLAAVAVCWKCDRDLGARSRPGDPWRLDYAGWTPSLWDWRSKKRDRAAQQVEHARGDPDDAK
jgi:hypothetical protein